MTGRLVPDEVHDAFMEAEERIVAAEERWARLASLEVETADGWVPVPAVEPLGLDGASFGVDAASVLAEDRRWTMEGRWKGPTETILDLFRANEERMRRERWHARRWARTDFMPPLPLDVLTCHH